METEFSGVAKRPDQRIVVTKRWTMTHDLSEYIKVVRRFVDRTISADEFERRYLRMFKDDVSIRPEAEYEVLNRLFTDVDVYSPNPQLRGTDGLDEEQLRDSACAALVALSARPSVAE